MIRLILADLAARSAVWLGAFAVTVATGFVAAFAAALIETGVGYGGQVLESLGSTSSAVIMFTSITALVVLSSIANLTVALQQRDYALWQLVDFRPALIGVIVLAQLAVVACLGTLVGCLLALPVLDPLCGWLFRTWDGMQGIDFHLGSAGMLAVTASVMVIVLLGGLRGARRASRTPPIEALREQDPPRMRMGWFRLLVLAGTLIAAIALIVNLDPEVGLSALGGQAMMITPFVAAVFAAAGPVLFPLVLRGWTSLVPGRASTSWYLARHAARQRLEQSTAAISPLLVGVALTGGLYTTAATIASGQDGGSGDIAPEGVVILLGGPLLLSAVAAAATVFMAGRARERELALLLAAGATTGTVLLTAVWEAVVYAVTATLLGVLAAVIGGFALSHAMGLPTPGIPLAGIGIVAGAGFVLVLAATLVPTSAALRHAIPRTLSAQ